jgi:hypothetical protein
MTPDAAFALVMAGLALVMAVLALVMAVLALVEPRVMAQKRAVFFDFSCDSF